MCLNLNNLLSGENLWIILLLVLLLCNNQSSSNCGCTEATAYC